MDTLTRIALVVLLGCTPLESGDDLRDVGSVDAGDATVDVGAPDSEPTDVGTDACPTPPTGCPPLCAREIELLGDNVGSSVRLIAIDQRLTCDKLYRMPDPTYVEPGAELVIEPGVVIQASSGAFLAVQSGARLVAEGTAEEPIVFTSATEEPQPGDWPGILMFGEAPTNTDDIGFLRWVDEDRAAYGGSDAAYDCGSLRYVRIEYAGRHRILGAPVDFVALTLAGCGTETSLDYVQLHATGGEGTQFIGGEFPVRHMVISEQHWEDAINWNLGWQGSIQWLVVHHSDENDENSIEGRISAFPFPRHRSARRERHLHQPLRRSEGRDVPHGGFRNAGVQRLGLGRRRGRKHHLPRHAGEPGLLRHRLLHPREHDRRRRDPVRGSTMR